MISVDDTRFAWVEPEALGLLYVMLRGSGQSADTRNLYPGCVPNAKISLPFMGYLL
jgi:hypothetical protein